MRPQAIKLVLIPGIGVDERLFEPQRALLTPFSVPKWIDPRQEDTLESYASRMADKIGPCDAIGGVSFGGMLAQAMAAAVGARVVIGIATARANRDIPGVLRFSESMARGISSIRAAHGRAVIDLGFLGPLSERWHKLSVRMLMDASIDLVRAQAKMAVGWKGAPVPCPAKFIHGDRDVVIRPRTFKPDRIIRGGG
ncbi:MAG TPA: hypothetical protein VGK61_08385, partial [Planctomycetota bacterium]